MWLIKLWQNRFSWSRIGYITYQFIIIQFENIAKEIATKFDYFTLDMSEKFYATATHSDLYAQCRPTYPVDIINKILDYLSVKVWPS